MLLEVLGGQEESASDQKRPKEQNGDDRDDSCQSYAPRSDHSPQPLLSAFTLKVVAGDTQETDPKPDPPPEGAEKDRQFDDRGVCPISHLDEVNDDE